MSSNYDSSSISSASPSETAIISTQAPETWAQKFRREAFETQLESTNASLQSLKDSITTLEVERSAYVPENHTEHGEMITLIRDLTRDMANCETQFNALENARVHEGDPAHTLTEHQFVVAQTQWQILERDGNAIRGWCDTELLRDKIDSPLLPDGYEDIRP